MAPQRLKGACAHEFAMPSRVLSVTRAYGELTAITQKEGCAGKLTQLVSTSAPAPRKDIVVHVPAGLGWVYNGLPQAHVTYAHLCVTKMFATLKGTLKHTLQSWHADQAFCSIAHRHTCVFRRLLLSVHCMPSAEQWSVPLL